MPKGCGRRRVAWGPGHGGSLPPGRARRARPSVGTGPGSRSKPLQLPRGHGRPAQREGRFSPSAAARRAREPVAPGARGGHPGVNSTRGAGPGAAGRRRSPRGSARARSGRRRGWRPAPHALARPRGSGASTSAPLRSGGALPRSWPARPVPRTPRRRAAPRAALAPHEPGGVAGRGGAHEVPLGRRDEAGDGVGIGGGGGRSRLGAALTLQEEEGGREHGGGREDGDGGGVDASDRADVTLAWWRRKGRRMSWGAEASRHAVARRRKTCGAESKPEPGAARYGNVGRKGPSFTLTPSPSSGARAALPPFGADSPEGRGEDAGHGPLLDVDHVVHQPAAVREPVRRPGPQAQAVLLGERLGRHGQVDPQQVRPGGLAADRRRRQARPLSGRIPVTRTVVRSTRFSVRAPMS